MFELSDSRSVFRRRNVRGSNNLIIQVRATLHLSYKIHSVVAIVHYIYPFAFRSGSVVAEFKLIFKTKVEVEEAFAPLKKGVKDGKMGPLSVDPESLKIIKETKGN